MNATDLTTSPDCLLNYNHYDVICHVINVYIYRKLAPGPPPSENPRSAPVLAPLFINYGNLERIIELLAIEKCGRCDNEDQVHVIAMT